MYSVSRVRTHTHVRTTLFVLYSYCKSATASWKRYDREGRGNLNVTWGAIESTPRARHELAEDGRARAAMNERIWTDRSAVRTGAAYACMYPSMSRSMMPTHEWPATRLTSRRRRRRLLAAAVYVRMDVVRAFKICMHAAARRKPAGVLRLI